MAIRDLIVALVSGRDLGQDEAAQAMDEIMEGLATPAQIAAFLTALYLKGETEAEIAGMAQVMREKAAPVPFSGDLLDTCGTGGDHAGTFNISTTAAFVAAGAGATVAKHGNRAMSSICGSADLLEGLGVAIDLDGDGVARCLRQAGFGFMFAPKFHPSMRHAGPVRREIGIRTTFNLLGPLTNPARARHQVLGVASVPLAEKLARALTRLDTTHALVVHGAGLDELSISGPSIIWEVRGTSQPLRYELQPEDLGLRRAPLAAVQGGDVATNVAITRSVLEGEQGPRRDVVLLNAAAALLAADMAGDLREGLSLARTSIDTGQAQQRMQDMVRASQG